MSRSIGACWHARCQGVRHDFRPSLQRRASRGMARPGRLADLARPALQVLPGARACPPAARPEGLAPELPGSALLGAAASVYSMNFLIPVIVLVGAIGLLGQSPLDE